jgi:hypothetical protein
MLKRRVRDTQKPRDACLAHRVTNSRAKVFATRREESAIKSDPPTAYSDISSARLTSL